MVEAVHEAFPHAAIFVRAFDRRAVIALRDAPVNGVVREVMESAVEMARQALDCLGVDGAGVDRTEEKYRSLDAERLKAQFETGDVRSARETILTQTEREAGECG